MDRKAARETRGFIKFRLGHAQWGSFVVVDAVFARRHWSCDKWAFYIPTFYGAPFLLFNIPEEAGLGSQDMFVMNANLCAPRKGEALPVEIHVYSNNRTKIYPDGAQLYACTIKHDEPLFANRAGMARQIDGDFDLKLYHHTSKETTPLIRKSEQFLGSNWNLQGTRQLLNVCYPYFTTLDKINNEVDLHRIAMASDGKLVLRGMAPLKDPVVEMTVYRSNTNDRKATLWVWVPVGAVSPNHLLRFCPQDDNAYYEVILPEVVRIGLKPNCALPIEGDRAAPVADNLHVFDYVICGDSSTREGLEAPYDEENTEQILHLENLQSESIFEFWQRNLNSDQVTGRQPSLRLLAPRASRIEEAG